MSKYNFKGFFKGRVVHNDEWASNGHFLIKKPLLTKGQINFINKFPLTEDTVKQLKNNLLYQEVKKYKEVEFIAEKINNLDVEPLVFNTIKSGNTELIFCLNADYYHFFKSLKCDIYITEEFKQLGAMHLYKENEFVGLVLPFRVKEEQYNNSIKYKDWEKQQEELKQKEKERKDNMKKCLYISSNKAVVRNKELLSIADLIQDEEYKNLYVESDYKKDGGQVFIDFGFICMSVTTLGKYDESPEDINYRLEKVKGFTFEDYKNHINKCLDNMQFINVAEIRLMELSGEFNKEYLQMLKDHRQKVLDLREEENKEREVKKQEEERNFLQQKEEELNNTITAVEQAILNNEKVENITIAEYKSKHEYNDLSAILYLMRKYGVKVPLKTQGWINNALANIYYNKEYEGYSYQYYTSSSNSTVFDKYLKELVDKVKVSI